VTYGYHDQSHLIKDLVFIPASCNQEILSPLSEDRNRNISDYLSRNATPRDELLVTTIPHLHH
jgi:hypothetical protein